MGFLSPKSISAISAFINWHFRQSVKLYKFANSFTLISVRGFRQSRPTVTLCFLIAASEWITPAACNPPLAQFVAAVLLRTNAISAAMPNASNRRACACSQTSVVLRVVETPAGQRKLRYRVSPANLAVDEINGHVRKSAGGR